MGYTIKRKGNRMRCKVTGLACSSAYRWRKCKCVDCREYKRTCENPADRYIRHHAWKLAHPEFRCFENMKRRCNNKNDSHYPGYGARGIKCLITSWHEIVSAIGSHPGLGYSIDRINNDGNYEVGNIRWATMKTQSNNTTTI